MNVTMQPDEIDLFRTYLSAANSYFEFGMGGSTCMAAAMVKGYVHAIDSDRQWVERIREITAGSGPRVNLAHVDIGPTGAWGTPIGTTHAHLFENYSLSIVGTGYPQFDLCLVDGRFRVACFLQALRFLGPDAIVGIHDYSTRPHYHLVERFAQPVGRCLSLAFFKRRHDADLVALGRTLDEYRGNPA